MLTICIILGVWALALAGCVKLTSVDSETVREGT